MLAIKRLCSLALLAGPLSAPKVVVGLLRMHWRYFLIGRGRGLARTLPLPTPLKIHIDPASHCNFGCFFCQQNSPEELRDAGLKSGVMKMPVLRSLVDGFSDLTDRIDEVVFGNYGEPLLNKHIAKMIAYAVASDHAREVSLVTNAALLDRQMAAALVDAGLHKIRISVEALSDEGYLQTTKSRTTFSEIVENISVFHALSRGRTFVYVKIVDTGLGEAEKRDFFRIFSPIADAVSIENLTPATIQAARIVGDAREGMTGVGPSSRRSVCPSPFYSLSVHVNGEVGACCADWYHKTSVGSLRQASLADIWNGELLRQFRADQLIRSWHQMDSCAGCEMVKHYPVYEDLDAHKQRLIPLYNKTFGGQAPCD